MKAVIEQLRLHQWSKNALILLPALLAHRVDDIALVLRVVASFVAFCFAASAVYTLNDLADSSSDALHPTKRQRPIPSGRLSRRGAYILLTVLVAAAGLIASTYTPVEVGQWLLVYGLLNVAYSYWLRGKVLVDVMLLGVFYTLRIWVGGAAAHVPLSPWLLAFSMFLFMGLAFLKRYTELADTVEREGRAVAGRGYHVGDASLVLVLGSTMGYLSVLVFVLYLNSVDVARLYPHAERLWLLAPLLIYWISHMWLVAHRGGMHDDPIVFMRKDAASYVVGILSASILSWAWFA